MFEIRDLDVPDHVYATVDTVADAEAYLEDRFTRTIAQLRANGEGAVHGRWSAAAVYHDDGVVVLTWSGRIPGRLLPQKGGAGPAGRP